MNLLEKAILLATSAHAGQVDKGGDPYILHPLRVMLEMNTEEEMIVAVLHDTIEDTALTLDDLAGEYSESVITAVNAITKIRGEKYEDYIKRVNDNDIAREVKIYDIYDNMNIKRLGREPTLKDRLRLAKYKAAKDFLLGA